MSTAIDKINNFIYTGLKLLLADVLVELNLTQSAYVKAPTDRQ